jgi:hypothetical protein
MKDDFGNISVYFVVADRNGVARSAWQVRTADAPTMATGAGSNAVNSARIQIALERCRYRFAG